VTFLSVGQGDAAVVELPRGRVVVVDGGGLPGAFDPGARVVAPFLRSRKIMRVDVLALSHPLRALRVWRRRSSAPERGV
jgi:competence protein ComEC